MSRTVTFVEIWLFAANMASRTQPPYSQAWRGQQRDVVPVLGSKDKPIFTATSPTNMTIDRRGFLSASASAMVLGKSGLSLSTFGPRADTPAPPEIERIEAREIAVYTTAANTEY